jgi:hypothetical protein
VRAVERRSHEPQLRQSDGPAPLSPKRGFPLLAAGIMLCRLDIAEPSRAAAGALPLPEAHICGYDSATQHSSRISSSSWRGGRTL